MDYAALSNEIKSDPEKLGYAKYITSGYDQALADLLNAPNLSVNIEVMSKGEFLLNIMPGLMTLLTASSELQAKWGFFLDIVKSVESVHLTHPSVQMLLAGLISDGLMTEEQMAFTTRAGSRAEVLFGNGVIINNRDISLALRGQG